MCTDPSGTITQQEWETKADLLLEHQDPGAEVHLKCSQQLCPVISANPCASTGLGLGLSSYLVTFYINVSQGQFKKMEFNSF